MTKVMTSSMPIKKTSHMISTRINAGTNSRYISLRMMEKVKMMIEMGKSDELDYRTTKLDRINVII